MTTVAYDMSHMANPSTFAGVRTGGKFFLESRDKVTGHLKGTVKLPFTTATEKQLCDHYWKVSDNDALSASQEEICKWYNDQEIYFRPKYW
jgi:hypothetical protein